MNTGRIFKNGNTIFEFLLEERTDEWFDGTISSPIASEYVELFGEWEEAVNDGALAVLNEIEIRISAYDFKAVFADGKTMDLEDIQVYPSVFKVRFC